jgi:retron-type reverse transcriptase
MSEDAVVNTTVTWLDPDWAELRVRKMQTKLHQWAAADPDRRFDDLFNLVHDPPTLSLAFVRVAGSAGAHTPRCGQNDCPRHRGRWPRKRWPSRRRSGASCRKTRAIWPRLDCLKPNPQW